MNIGLRNKNKVDDTDSSTKCIRDAARKNLSVSLGGRTFAYAETISTYNSVCVARTTGEFSQEKRLTRRCHRHLKGENKWSSRTKEFEKAWEEKDPRKAYTLLMQYRSKTKGCSPVLNSASGVVDGESTLHN
ncbi:hypothetical protein RB195_000021 [Necator americanus]|uniref:SCP domain-containing protein n=1 Tax=Necator americanus TaxID=51031 RepID=A0ABR1D8G9_NECAM